MEAALSSSADAAGPSGASSSQSGPAFAVDEVSYPASVVGLESYSSSLALAPRIDRARALQVPAVKRSRDLIAGTLGGLPLELFGPDRRQQSWRLFEQPEANVPRSVTMTKTFEDLLFDAVAWWRIAERDYRGWPTAVKRLEVGQVTVTNGVVYVDGKAVPDADLIRFHSPNPGLLTAGALAIRTCLRLDHAAANAADGVPPVDYFTPSEQADPAGDGVIEELLDDWDEARRNRTTAYVPYALKYNVAGWDPEKLQLAEARQHAVLDIARLTGLDPEDLGVSTTSRTYQNGFERRKALIDFTLAPYMVAVQDVLSMRNVTQQGYAAQFNPDGLLRADAKSRYEAYAAGLAVGAITPERVAEIEGVPVASVRALPGAQTVDQNGAPVAASHLRPVQNFSTGPDVRLDAVGAEVFEVNVEERTIRGLAVPYGKAALSGGMAWQFSKGTLQYADVSRVKLWVQHDASRAVGVATKLEDTDAGLVATFKVARGAEGDQALSLAEDGVLDGLSIGLKNGGKFQTRDGIQHAVEAPLMEISLTPAPAFDDARVHAVAASAARTGVTMPCTLCGAVHAAGVTECDATVRAAFEAANTGPTFDAQPIADAITAGFAGLVNPQGGPGLVQVGQFEVNEPSPYRFDGTEGAESFSEDLRSYNQDPEARQRLETFMEDAWNHQFAVTSGNTGALNPAQNRPDLFVPNLTFTRPLWEMVSTGVVTNKTPFTIPKFASASGLVGPHTEGVEPTPGAFSATSQTVTPAPVSGKVEIVREVWEQGGSPQADQIIWGEMQNGYYEAVEAKIAAQLAAVSTAEINLASAVDAALVNLMTGIFVDLQFVRGGNRYSRLALDGLLFKALVNAADGNQRKLLPLLGPANAQGQTSGGFDRVAIGTQEGRAAWALGSTNASKSYLFVPSSVWAWASAPKKFTFEYRVSAIDLAIWGYTASAVLRDSDVKPIDYTTADV
ncbi:hypothetical protein GCM10027596_26750 [Nocardioides korecus]